MPHITDIRTDTDGFRKVKLPRVIFRSSQLRVGETKLGKFIYPIVWVHGRAVHVLLQARDPIGLQTGAIPTNRTMQHT